MVTSILVKVRNLEWLQGHVGPRVKNLLQHHLPGLRVERMPVGFSVSGPHTETWIRDRALAALRLLEQDIQRIDPVRRAVLGPVTLGTVHCVAPSGTVEMHVPAHLALDAEAGEAAGT